MMTYIVAELWIFLDCHLEPEHDFLLLYILSKKYLVNFFSHYLTDLYIIPQYFFCLYTWKSH